MDHEDAMTMTASATNSQQLMTIEEVASDLRISRAKAYGMAASGELPTIRLGRSVRVRRDRLMSWLDERSTR